MMWVGAMRIMASSGFESKPPIAIIGGGLGGLVLARTLQMRGMEAVVYEMEASRDARSQGGSLDLHPESGQRALLEAGLKAEFQGIVRPQGEDLRIVDKHGTVHWEEITSATQLPQRPEVDRQALRSMLLDSLLPGTLVWGHKLTAIASMSHGAPYQLTFAGQPPVQAAIVVGADGAWSKVRSFLTDVTPEYTGVSFVEVVISDAASRHPNIAEMVGQGSFFALADKKGLIAQCAGDGSIRTYAVMCTPEHWHQNFRTQYDSPAKARKAVLEIFVDWDSGLSDLVRYCDDTLVARPIYTLPLHQWQRKPRLTLLGDAAHLMSPFAGEGANMAMLDALELASHIEAQQDVDIAIDRFEVAMFERASIAGQDSAQGLEVCIAPDGAERFARLMAERMGGV